MPCWVEVVIGQGKSAMLCRTRNVVEMAEDSGQVEWERRRGRHFLVDGVLRTTRLVEWTGLSLAGGRDEAGAGQAQGQAQAQGRLQGSKFQAKEQLQA